MKYCPKCGSEFFDDVNCCEACNSRLVNDTEWQEIVHSRRAQDDEVFVTVMSLDDQFEADVIKDALENENIPVLVRSFLDSSFDGIFETQKGWGLLMVPNDLRSKAKQIINDLVPSRS